MSALEKWEKVSITSLSITSTLALIFGGLFALCEYNDHKANIKRNTSLELVSEYYSDTFFKYREKLLKSSENDHRKLNSLSDQYDDKEKKANEYSEYVLEKISKENLSTEVNNVMNFYERLVICTSTNLCDKEIIDNYFKESGRTFFRKYYPYVCKLRKEWNDYSIWSKVENYFNPGGIGKICR